MDNDIEAALDWLKNSSGTNVQQVALIGESLGADLALRAGARYPEIPAVVLLSPGMQLWEIKIDEAIVNYGSRPLLLVSSEENSNPAATVRQLDEQALGPHELLLLPGSAHGTKMFNANPNLTNQIFSWLHETIQ
jgi:pimeloyl-ACP methyl ester carboxylesterase